MFGQISRSKRENSKSVNSSLHKQRFTKPYKLSALCIISVKGVLRSRPCSAMLILFHHQFHAQRHVSSWSRYSAAGVVQNSPGSKHVRSGAANSGLVLHNKVLYHTASSIGDRGWSIGCSLLATMNILRLPCLLKTPCVLHRISPHLWLGTLTRSCMIACGR